MLHPSTYLRFLALTFPADQRPIGSSIGYRQGFGMGQGHTGHRIPIPFAAPSPLREASSHAAAAPSDWRRSARDFGVVRVNLPCVNGSQESTEGLSGFGDRRAAQRSRHASIRLDGAVGSWTRSSQIRFRPGSYSLTLRARATAFLSGGPPCASVRYRANRITGRAPPQTVPAHSM